MAIASISEKIRDPRSKKRNLVMFLGLILLVAVLFISMIIGTANTSFSDLYNVFVGVQNTEVIEFYITSAFLECLQQCLLV